MSGQLTIVLSARPDPTYTPASHRGSVRIKAREVLVGTLTQAVEALTSFATNHNLGPVNLLRAGLVRRDGQPLCRVGYDGKLLEVDQSGLATGRRYTDPDAPRPRWRRIGDIVRVLRENAGLIRRDVAEAVGIAPETLRNLEVGRHAPTGATWTRLLAHPALRDLPQLAAEAGLELPLPVPDPGTTGGTTGGTTEGEPGGTGGGGGDGGDEGAGGTPGSGGRT